MLNEDTPPSRELSQQSNVLKKITTMITYILVYLIDGKHTRQNEGLYTVILLSVRNLIRLYHFPFPNYVCQQYIHYY